MKKNTFIFLTIKLTEVELLMLMISWKYNYGTDITKETSLEVINIKEFKMFCCKIVTYRILVMNKDS